MSKTQIEIGGSLRGMLSEVAEAWKAAERGEAFTPVNTVVFLDHDTFAAIVTPRRRELLVRLRQAPEPGLRALARALERDAATVHRDVKALQAAGLLTVHDDGTISTDVDEVAVTFRVVA